MAMKEKMKRLDAIFSREMAKWKANAIARIVAGGRGLPLPPVYEMNFEDVEKTTDH